MAANSSFVIFRPVWCELVSSSALILSPALVLVFPIRFTTTDRLTGGLPRQFSVIWQTIRCSILFHLLVPGGEWHTAIRRPVSSASPCKATFHSRERLPLLPPPSAVTRRSVARGWTFLPILDHQRRKLS